MVRLEGFEPPTCCSGGNRSIHLSYRRMYSKFNGLDECGQVCSPKAAPGRLMLFWLEWTVANSPPASRSRPCGSGAEALKSFGQDRVPKSPPETLPGAWPECQRGEVSERLKEHAWKACSRVIVTWVRIPPSPPRTVWYVALSFSPFKMNRQDRFLSLLHLVARSLVVQRLRGFCLCRKPADSLGAGGLRGFAAWRLCVSLLFVSSH